MALPFCYAPCPTHTHTRTATHTHTHIHTYVRAHTHAHTPQKVDEPPATMIKRVPFVAPAAGGGLEYDPIENSADNRAAYRHLLFSTPNLSDHVSGVILHEETLFQQSPELYEGQQQNFVSMLNSRGIVRMGKAFGQRRDQERWQFYRGCFECALCVAACTSNRLRRLRLVCPPVQVPGIKVDRSFFEMMQPNQAAFLQGEGHVNETVTEGLDGLGERCDQYYAQGARFAKWRAVFHVSASTPSETSLTQNCQGLARCDK